MQLTHSILTFLSFSAIASAGTCCDCLTRNTDICDCVPERDCRFHEGLATPVHLSVTTRGGVGALPTERAGAAQARTSGARVVRRSDGEGSSDEDWARAGLLNELFDLIFR
ncbi:hypothetical protein B9Z65_8800 [Elsinoe australis]|uniref:Uncharacterized protein n=1 Tax=Elsinoe australis TaxID=40998 RepID=A0A2P7YET1_9PEZI|nr:hypothetical protein B9Z65_8800 [Elsinoe australis]